MFICSVLNCLQITMENNKENDSCDDKKGRSRGDNWTQVEKDIFMEIMQVSAIIVENKQTDTDSNKRKYLEWIKIQNRMKELTGKQRDIPQLKGFWRRTKLAAKKSAYQHGRKLTTAGGVQIQLSPLRDDVDDLKTMDFVEATYDSDSMSQSEVQDNVTMEYKNEAHYSDREVNEDLKNEAEFVNVTVTESNADVHENKVDTNTCNEDTPQSMKVPKMEQKQCHDNCRGNNLFYSCINETNIELKQRALALMEEEYALKRLAQKQEIAHQQMQHRLQIEILMLEKEKKKLELEILKKQILQ